MTGFVVRPAKLEDAAGINAVYNPFICDSAITFETVEHTPAQRRDWLASLAASPRTPVFIAEAGGEIAGFANAAPFDPRGAYETSVKASVFVKPEAAGKGLAKALYEALFAALAQADVHRAYALIVAPNPASVALHQRFGFAHKTTLSEVGRKFGRYHDVMWFEKRF